MDHQPWAVEQARRELSAEAGGMLAALFRPKTRRVFLALGDSMVSDDYPGKDRGAAALVFRNCDQRFPEFKGRDLASRHAGLEFVNRTRTGYRLADVERSEAGFEGQVDWLLLCVGGNDLLSGELEPKAFAQRYRRFIAHCQQRYRSARRAICNAYDPTDGTGSVFSAIERGKPPRPELLEHLRWLNELTASCAGEDLVDVHGHFLGHAVLHGERPQWIFKDIEPNQEGASELRRRVWERFE